MKKIIASACMLFLMACSTNSYNESIEDTRQMIEKETAEESKTAVAQQESKEQPNSYTEMGNLISDKQDNSYKKTQENTVSGITSSDTEDTIQEGEMIKIQVMIGTHTFSARLFDNETTKVLVKQLPMTLDMSELNGNEKYYYLPENLPTDSKMPDGLHSGELMLYGSNCVVLFYKDFSSSYSYTPLGYIEDVSGLISALGSGSVEVTFSRE